MTHSGFWAFGDTSIRGNGVDSNYYRNVNNYLNKQIICLKLTSSFSLAMVVIELR